VIGRRLRLGSTSLFFATLASIAGCKVGPDPARPDIPTPESFRAATESQTAASPDELTWYALFEDPVLRELIREALAGNDDLAIAAARVREARAASAIADSRLFPTIDGNVGIDTQGIPRQGFPIFPEPQDRDGFTQSLGGFASWEIDLWGRYARAADAASADLLARELDRAAVMQTLVVEVAASYFRMIAADENLAITNRTIKSREASRELVKARLEQGIASKLELRQAESLLQSAQLFVPVYESQREREENLISLLLGRNPDAVPRGEPLAKQVETLEVPAGLPSQLLERRPDLVAAEAQLAAATSRIGEAKALLYPQLTLTAFGGVNSQDLSNLFDASSTFWDAALTLTIPIFNAGRLEANVAATEARAEQAARSYLKAVRTAFKEVSDGLISLEKLREFRRIQEERVAVLTDQASLSQTRYKGGVTSYLEVLDSERQLFEGEQSLVSARLDEVSAVGFLFRALGGGWESLAKEAPADSGDSATAASEDNPTPPLRTAEASRTSTQ
jgi:multidrug efflux system outer membrane protein